ncbi:WD40 repeat-like protein [Suillus weaverae]|nr:WD40 repeat-like protein [Suillus weaverae]
MTSKTGTKQRTPAVTPRQTMRGHIDGIQGVVHLPMGQQIITCSRDGSLRLWDLKSSSQIGEDWKEEGRRNGKTVVIGSDDGKMRLWDVKMGKVVAEWMGHTSYVVSVCWSANVSDRWHASLFTNLMETLGNLIQTPTLNDLAGPAIAHKDRVWAENKGFDAIDGNCHHPGNSGKDGKVDELNRPHGTCYNHALVVAVGTRKPLTKQSLVE